MDNKTLNEDLLMMDELDEMKVKLSKPHPFYAGVCDFYISATIIAGIIALLESMSKKSIFGSDMVHLLIQFLILNVSIIVLVIIYHSVISKKVLWLSLGEKIAGKFIYDNKKVWRNPYKVNRWGLFLQCIIALIILGNSFDSISSGQVYTSAMLTGKFIGFFIKIYCLVMIGQGKLKALLAFAGFNAFSIFTILQWHLPALLLVVPVILLLGDLIIYFAYYKLSGRSSERIQ